MTGPTDKDRQSARALAAGFYDVQSPEARDKAEDAIAYRIATEREWALKPFRELEDGYPLGTNVPVYRIGRAIEEVERSAAGIAPAQSGDVLDDLWWADR